MLFIHTAFQLCWVLKKSKDDLAYGVCIDYKERLDNFQYEGLEHPWLCYLHRDRNLGTNSKTSTPQIWKDDYVL